MRKAGRALLLFVLLMIQQFALAAPVFAQSSTQACQWAIEKGKYTFCTGQFDTLDDLKQATVNLSLEGVGGFQSFRVGSVVDPTTGQFPYAVDGGGKYYTCVSGDTFTESVFQAFERMYLKSCATAITAGAVSIGTILATPLTGGLSLAVGLVVSGSASAVAAANVNQCANGLDQLTINLQGNLVDKNGSLMCSQSTPIDLEVAVLQGGAQVDPCNSPGKESLCDLEPFRLCAQIKDTTLFQKCVDCAGGDQPGGKDIQGIWTGIGCISTNETNLIQSFVRAGLGISGGLALLMFIAAGFMLSTSQGDQKRVTEARELLTSAIFGLLFIIFSVAILQFIGVKVLQIPGFGDAATGLL